ncbi:AMP-dependent synthetase/ligase [Bythopirellula polymerisocia]|uniref:Long-chain-fatty-acid--CoA ligase FadD15 n=1 Tax=Bythopirellula polymerisocia TaxID=2528003 RepID=A0A5C6CUW9_9BACT|nr:AMP-dependent synthetase/ligase [Bythopirellula polymerisocia]TWU28228.1 Long-chain-fatty-acid--CoA ligase FadD15 [Bythopirellula polymerisocia]
MPEHYTIPELLSDTVARYPDKPALGTILGSQLSWRTWQQVSDDVQRFIAALQRKGVKPGDRVAQFAPNSYEWILTDLAILSLGAVHVPLHASLAAVQLSEQVAKCEACLLILDGETGKPETSLLQPNGKCLTYSALLDGSASGIPQSSNRNPQSEDLATILFTSGTTGQPRGVMLSHGNLVRNAIATTEAVGSPSDETRLCFLPLSHIYARTCDLYTWIFRGSRLVLAESRETILRDCQLVKPTVLNGVPYFYQKVAQQLYAAGKSRQPGVLGEVFGGKIKMLFCGGAAIAPETESLFASQDLPLLAGYGLTESSPVISATKLENYQAGTVGRPLPGVEVRIAEDGEIQVRGPNVMQGYWQDDAATREAIVDEWLYTGDLGEFDREGNLRIVGRRKEIIVLSTGKNVSPMAVEQRILGSPLVESVCVFGEGRSCLAALIVPNPVALREQIRKRRLWVWSRHRAVTHPQIVKLYREEIDRLLSEASREEKVGPFVILDRAFSQERGEITAKLSLRRETIATNFGREIAVLFRRAT